MFQKIVLYFGWVISLSKCSWEIKWQITGGHGLKQRKHVHVNPDQNVIFRCTVVLREKIKTLFEGTWFQRGKLIRSNRLWFYAFLEQALGDLGTLEAGENGEAQFSGSKEKLRVVDLIGRSIALYATDDRSDPGIAAAVIARSAGVGENYKKLCTCDGVTIWESS